MDHPTNTIQIGHNFSEKIDENTSKVLCVSCGGKGFYLEIVGMDTKGELVSCLDCEKGFRYGKREIQELSDKLNGKQ